jgi:hypothetical protein
MILKLFSIIIPFLTLNFISGLKPVIAQEYAITPPAAHIPHPATRNPQPVTRNSQLVTQNPQSATRNPQPDENNLQSADLDEIINAFEEDEKPGEEANDIIKGFEDQPQKEAQSDEFMKGFEEDAEEKKADKAPAEEKPSTWSLDGEFKFTTTYNFAHRKPEPGQTDWRGLSMLRPELELALTKKISDSWQAYFSVRGFYDFVYALKDRENYTEQVLDDYEKELEIEDAYIQGNLTDSLDLKAGRQIVVWGTFDNLRVTDVLNPLDLRVPGLTDIDDLRLPVTMIKLDYYFSHWNLSGMVLPEIRFSKLPVFGSDFYPFQAPAPPEDIPQDGFENAEFAASLSGTFGGWDLAFYWADIYDDAPHTELVSPGPPPQLEQKHARIKMVGAAFNIAAGNWLLKAETAWFDGLRFTNTPNVEYSRFDLGAGVEYAGFQDATVSLEAANRHINDYNKLLEQSPDEIRENEFQWALRITKDFINDTLTLTLLAATFGIKADDGSFERFDTEYDVTDAVSVRGGVVFYQSGDLGRFKNIGDNDRLFFEIKYSF